MKTPPLLLAALLWSAVPAFAQDDQPKETASPKEPPVAESKAEITVPGAKNEEQAKARIRADAAVSRCAIKPVMTDDEIQACIRAYRQSDREIAQSKKAK